jgi:hypothetical protein
MSRKGFASERSHKHRYFYHEYKGKRTGAYTYTSHGSEYKTYGDPLLNLMKRQLKLDSIRQVADLCNCPISAEQYNAILRSKKVLPD